jgi:hypothetical protein
MASRGTNAQERFIAILGVFVSPDRVDVICLILWGLRISSAGLSLSDARR